MPKEAPRKVSAQDQAAELAAKMREIKERAKKKDQKGFAAEGKFVPLTRDGKKLA
jgi:hypothetical protein